MCQLGTTWLSRPAAVGYVHADSTVNDIAAILFTNTGAALIKAFSVCKRIDDPSMPGPWPRLSWLHVTPFINKNSLSVVVVALVVIRTFFSGGKLVNEWNKKKAKKNKRSGSVGLGRRPAGELNQQVDTEVWNIKMPGPTRVNISA